MLLRGHRNVVPFLSFFISILIFIGAKGSFAASQGSALDYTIHQPFVSIRALGMGNAGVAVADDYAAMFYNPAGLAWLPDSQWNFELRAMVDKDVIKFKNDLETASKSENVADMANLFANNYGKHYSSRLPTLGAYYVRPGGWGIAIIPVDLSLELEIHQRVGPAVGVVATQDSTIAYSLAHDFKKWGKNKLAVGFTLKTIYRAYFNASYNGIDFAFDKNLVRAEDAKEGMTVDGDLGVLFRPDVEGSWLWFLRPTLGFAVRNIADYGFTSNYHFIDPNSGRPPGLQRRFDVGTMVELPDFWIFKSRFAVDVRDMGHQNFTMRKGTHAGFEFLWKIFGWWKGGWRVGLNQGYVTGGFTGKLGIFKLDLATYGEEVGPSTAALENRRYMAKCSLDF